MGSEATTFPSRAYTLGWLAAPSAAISGGPQQPASEPCTRESESRARTEIGLKVRCRCRNFSLQFLRFAGLARCIKSISTV
jgi:hypothetical protein